MLTRMNNRGDTIVEVLIATVVMSAVLSTTYAIATSSLQATQLTQERSYALKIAQGQLERLKVKAVKGQLFSLPLIGFCLDKNLIKVDITGGSPKPVMDDDVLDQSTYGGCRIDSQNPDVVPGLNCTGYCYYFSLLKSSSDPDSYTSTVRWEGPRGLREQVQLHYRLYDE